MSVIKDRKQDKETIKDLEERLESYRNLLRNSQDISEKHKRELKNLTENYNAQSYELLRANQTVEALQYALNITRGNLEVTQKLLLKHGILEIEIKQGRNALVEKEKAWGVMDKVSVAVKE